ncbi:hypothetical protein [Thermus tengchongensis]|uniref:Uncharacterized protein n=1 Tax=Thermus tengchongensis TaxID=1214928 RepID=A0ABY2K3R7_9DEIN|nr:hypothetical protein [Thermus tengchongensis]TFU14682.1 hypothetical protein E0489_11720 [Thermus tengchongensis]
MLKLRLPEELLGEKAVLEGSGEAPRGQEVRAIPMEGPLDPVLEEAVESQPVVGGGVSAGSREAFGNPQEGDKPVQEETSAKAATPPAKKTPLGFLAALGAGMAVLLGVALGMKGGGSGSGSGTHAGAGHASGAGNPGGTLGPRLWE